MIYNAMKFFMEVNPQLYDDCSHDYTELQNTAEQREQNRQRKWDKLAEQAKAMQQQQNGNASTKVGTARGSKTSPSSRMEEDSMTTDSQQRLDALKLQDEASDARDSPKRRDHDGQSLVEFPPYHTPALN